MWMKWGDKNLSFKKSGIYAFTVKHQHVNLVVEYKTYEDATHRYKAYAQYALNFRIRDGMALWGYPSAQEALDALYSYMLDKFKTDGAFLNYDVED